MATISALRFAGGYTPPKPKSPERATPPQYVPWYQQGQRKPAAQQQYRPPNMGAGVTSVNAGFRDWFGTSKTRTRAPNKYANYTPPIPGSSPTQNMRPITPVTNPQRGVPGYNVQGMYNTSGVRPQTNQLPTYTPTDYSNFTPPVPGSVPTYPGMGYTPSQQGQPLPPLRGAGYDSGIDAGNIRPPSPAKPWVWTPEFRDQGYGNAPTWFGPFGSSSQGTVESLPDSPYGGWNSGYGGYGGYGGGGGGGGSYKAAASWYNTLVNWRI